MLHLKKTHDTPRDSRDRVGNTSLQDSRSIILRRFRKWHTNQTSLDFPSYCTSREQIIKLPFIILTQNSQSLHMDEQHSNLAQMLRHCQGKIWIDHSSLSQQVFVARQSYVTKKSINIQYLKETPVYNITKTAMLWPHFSGKHLRLVPNPLQIWPNENKKSNYGVLHATGSCKRSTIR